MKRKRKIKVVVEHRHYDGAQREKQEADAAFWDGVAQFAGAVIGIALWVIPASVAILTLLEWIGER